MFCVRCKQRVTATIVSMFNLDEICLPCKDKEEQHPAYTEAALAEEEAVRKGDLNFPGIGKPYDL